MTGRPDIANPNDLNQSAILEAVLSGNNDETVLFLIAYLGSAPRIYSDW